MVAAGLLTSRPSRRFNPSSTLQCTQPAKSFVLLFSEALWLELAPRGVHVLAVCPGPVVTSFFERIGSKPPPRAISAERVISETLQPFGRKQAVLVPGTLATRVQAFAHRVLPRTVFERHFSLKAAPLGLGRSTAGRNRGTTAEEELARASENLKNGESPKSRTDLTIRSFLVALHSPALRRA